MTSVSTDLRRQDTSGAILRVMALLGGGLAFAGTTALVVMGHAGAWWELQLSLFAMFAVFFSLFVLLASGRESHNRVVWVMAISTLCAGWYVGGVAAVGSQVPELLVDQSIAPSQLPDVAALFLAATEWAGVPAFLLMLTLGILLFPSGRLPSRHWRLFAWLAIPTVAFPTLILAWSRRPQSTVPIADEGMFFEAGFLASSLLAAFCVISLVPRYRTASGRERQQIRWVAWGASVMVASIFLTFLLEVDYPVASAGVVHMGTLALLGSYGIAVARFRLYDIDLVISRTVVLVTLVGFITAVYVLIVVGLGSLIGAAGDGLVLPIAATAVVAVAFEPARQRAQRWANRVAYGRRATPYEVLSDLSQRLATSEDASEVLDTMASLLAAGTGAERATVWLGGSGDMEPAATWPPGTEVDGAPDLESETVFPAYHEGEVVGALELVKPKGTAITPMEMRLLSDLAGSAELVLSYWKLNDALEERARELEESRRRLVGAQDRERIRLERELRDGAQELIESLSAGLDQIANSTGVSEFPELESLLGTLSREARDALEEVRSLARGIYPPVLDSGGLTAAISSLTEGSPVPIDLDVNGLRRYRPEIETAVYFDVSEALTNAIKHADPPIHIKIEESDDLLRFSVTDAGPGFDVSVANLGSGLSNMVDRLEAVGGSTTIDSTHSGTSVIGEVPLDHAHV